MAFTMKRHDLRPYLDAQFFLPDGTTPLSIATATSVNMVCRQAGAGVVKFKKPCIIVDAALGKVQYKWSATDTDTSGQFEYEFEIAWPAGELQTIPADSYFSLVIVDDVG